MIPGLDYDKSKDIAVARELAQIEGYNRQSNLAHRVGNMREYRRVQREYAPFLDKIGATGEKITSGISSSIVGDNEENLLEGLRRAALPAPKKKKTAPLKLEESGPSAQAEDVSSEEDEPGESKGQIAGFEFHTIRDANNKVYWEYTEVPGGGANLEPTPQDRTILYTGNLFLQGKKKNYWPILRRLLEGNLSNAASVVEKNLRKADQQKQIWLKISAYLGDITAAAEAKGISLYQQPQRVILQVKGDEDAVLAEDFGEFEGKAGPFKFIFEPTENPNKAQVNEISGKSMTSEYRGTETLMRDETFEEIQNIFVANKGATQQRDKLAVMKDLPNKTEQERKVIRHLWSALNKAVKPKGKTRSSSGSSLRDATGSKKQSGSGIKKLKLLMGSRASGNNSRALQQQINKMGEQAVKKGQMSRGEFNRAKKRMNALKKKG